MKKALTLLMAAALSVPAMAQQYIYINGDTPFPADEVEKITYEADPDFESSLLSGMIAADEKLTIFSQALKQTGLADTLKAFILDGYTAPWLRKYYYVSHTWSEVAWYNEKRFRTFTVFAETDSTLAAHGITNLSDLMAYAKKVYDAFYPEDASVTDPTDRRHSLNRFVAYHILGHGLGNRYLTVYDGWTRTSLSKCFDYDLTDIAAWYATLMPNGSLKISYPYVSDDDAGYYLNRRGLKDGADKYGKQIRGAKVSNEQWAFNGYYNYIDDILAYDQQTREEVLGGERWRVDFKALSPDFMNNADWLRGNYLRDDNSSSPDDSEYPQNGRNYVYKWDAIENITANDTIDRARLVHRRAHCNFWSWQGDEINIFGKFDFTIKLPPLPPGEWEVRMGLCALEARPDVRVYLNGEVTIDSLRLRRYNYGVDLPFDRQHIQDEILEYMKKYVFTVEKDGNVFLVTDVKTGEKILMTQDPYENILKNRANGKLLRGFNGLDPETQKREDWGQRGYNYREQATMDYIATLPKVMLPSPECRHFSPSGQIYPFTSRDEYYHFVRYPLGRIKCDGKRDNYLRLQCLSNHNNFEMLLDYFEFVPAAVADNQEIPEDVYNEILYY